MSGGVRGHVSVTDRSELMESALACLSGHRDGPAGGRGGVEEILRILATADAPFDRTSFDPGHVTVGGLVLSPDRSSLLLVHHLRLGRWVQPGGHVEPQDATLEEAAAREVEEETGVGRMVLLGLIDVDVHAVPAWRAEPQHVHFDVRFGFVAADTAIRPGRGVDRVVWSRIDDIVQLGCDASLVASVRAVAGRVQRDRW